MYLILAIFIFLYIWLKDSLERAEIDQRANKLREQGQFLPHNYKLYKEYYDDMTDEFIHGRRDENYVCKYVPKKYSEYFKDDFDMACSFFLVKADERIAKEGFHPEGVITYNKFDYHPISRFEENYGRKIERWNERNGFSELNNYPVE